MLPLLRSLHERKISGIQCRVLRACPTGFLGHSDPFPLGLVAWRASSAYLRYLTLPYVPIPAVILLYAGPEVERLECEPLLNSHGIQDEAKATYALLKSTPLLSPHQRDVGVQRMSIPSLLMPERMRIIYVKQLEFAPREHSRPFHYFDT
ncbi:hypothetical protein BDR22DRAFT_581163 [Usnea florida]